MTLIELTYWEGTDPKTNTTFRVMKEVAPTKEKAEKKWKAIRNSGQLPRYETDTQIEGCTVKNLGEDTCKPPNKFYLISAIS